MRRGSLNDVGPAVTRSAAAQDARQGSSSAVPVVGSATASRLVNSSARSSGDVAPQGGAAEASSAQRSRRLSVEPTPTWLKMRSMPTGNWQHAWDKAIGHIQYNFDNGHPFDEITATLYWREGMPDVAGAAALPQPGQRREGPMPDGAGAAPPPGRRDSLGNVVPPPPPWAPSVQNRGSVNQGRLDPASFRRDPPANLNQYGLQNGPAPGMSRQQGDAWARQAQQRAEEWA
jgi:hypothetical protein